MIPPASRQATGRGLVRALTILAVILAVPAAASAQVSAIGTTTDLVGFFVRGVDVAFDAMSGGYLVVGAQNTVIGICTNAQGQPTGAPMTIKPAGAAFGAFPRARYSQAANGGRGAFLVVWPEEAADHLTSSLHSRMVSCTDGLLGTEQIISASTSPWLESGAAVAYSITSQKFFVAWKTFAPVSIQGRLVDLSGAGVGTQVTLSAGFGRDPGVAWNSASDEFGVSYSGETDTTAFSVFVRVPAANPAAFTRSSFNTLNKKVAMTTITDLDYNPGTNRYVMSWFEVPGMAKSAEIDAAGNVLVEQRLTSSLIGSYDALSAAFNPISKTMLLGGVDRVNDDVYVAELDGNGVRIGAETKVSTSTRPARYPRVTSSLAHATWNTAFNTGNFVAMANQVVQTSTAGAPGTPTPAPAPAPAPAPSPVPTTTTPRMNVDIPAAGAHVSGSGFAIAGWAIDAAATGTSGVDAIEVWAYPANGSPAFYIGAASYGTPRPDVGAAFAQSYFGGSGFLLTTVLSPGTYDLVVYARSTIAGAFNNAQQVRVTVDAPVSVPRMWVDVPTANSDQSQNIRVSGWALDLAPGGTTGVDTVHVWAYPTSGAPPLLVGVASMGLARPDVAAAFGSTRFNNSGFNLQGTLPPGPYTLVVFAHSSIANAFNNVFVVNIQVR